jgi:hypothetical protein
MFSSKGAQLHVPLTDLPQIEMLHFLSRPSAVSQESPVNETPSRFPKRDPYGESCLFPEPSFMRLLDSPVKVLLTEKSHPSLKVPGKGASPSCSPKRDPYGNRRPFPEPYLTYLSGSPAEETSLQVPLTQLPQREMLHFQSSPHPSLQVPGKLAPSKFCNGAPMERDACF